MSSLPWRNLLDRVRKICLALPEAHEVIAWGAPTFRVRNKLFAMYASGQNHHGAGRNSIWCKATHIDQELLIRSDPDRFFRPPYVGPSGWVGIYLDGSPDWDAIAAQLGDAHRLIAPKKLLDRANHAAAPRKRSQATNAAAQPSYNEEALAMAVPDRLTKVVGRSDARNTLYVPWLDPPESKSEAAASAAERLRRRDDEHHA